MHRFRVVVAVLYVGVICAFFGFYYYAERTANADTTVDATPLLILAGVLGFPAGLLIARVWAIVLPLAAFPLATVVWMISSFDERYTARYDDHAALRGVEWIIVAYIFATFAIPAMAGGIGVGFAARHLLVKRFTRLGTR